ncbi:MAG: STAS domain-containing protein [Aromatoleum sp.]|nr:STAS domain-containing protein [Aromatoleum sp.]
MPPLALKALPFLGWRDRVDRESLRADLVAGLVAALIVLPQAVAFATLAGLPPEFGLYGAMVPAVIGALWGSSWHLMSGPTNATSLMVFATMGALAAPFSPEYIALVLTLNLMIGLLKLGFGLARLGTLVNFISHTVIVGFTAGAGVLIVGAQLSNAGGLVALPQEAAFVDAVRGVVLHSRDIDPWSALIAAVTIAAALAARRLLPRTPHLLVGIVVGSLVAWLLAREGIAHVATIGPLPSALPSWSMPSFSAGTWRTLAPIALALTLIGLTEAVSSARAVAAKSGQRLDGNQEFIGQGLANIVGAFTSCYPTSGSFNRTTANYEAGARTPLAAVFSAPMLLGIVLMVAPLAAYLPLAAMAGVLFLVAWALIDFAEMRRIVRASRVEALVLATTFFATLLLQLEFAIFLGVLVSFLVYLHRTTHPQLTPVAPDPASPRRRFAPLSQAGTPGCPQLALLRVDGSLFFGAVDHVGDELTAVRAAVPGRRDVLLVGSGINFIDVAGAELLVREARLTAETGGTLYLCNLKPTVSELLERGGFLDAIGRARVFDTKDDAIRAIYATLAAARCRVCTARIFSECATMLPDGSLRED